VETSMNLESKVDKLPNFIIVRAIKMKFRDSALHYIPNEWEKIFISI
jgi:hypothetical protein